MLVYILLGMIFLLILALLWLMTRTPPMVQVLVNQNRELLNRLQAPDVRTFAALQNYSTINTNEDEQISRSDEAEAARINDPNGYGDIILDDGDVRQYAMQDFGIGLNAEDFQVPRLNQP